jgi:hypothetical protein
MTRWLLIGVALLSPKLLEAKTVEGKNYPSTVVVEGKTLKLVGAGLREKWFFNVYALGAYSESGKCDPKAVVESDEPKYMRIDMLRDVSASKMASTIGDAFEEHLPKNASGELQQQNRTFQSYFKDECAEGTVLEFIYTPGTGTTLKQNGKTLGPVLTGSAFARVLWDIYFGSDSCCSDLKEQVFETCGLKL